MRINTKDKRNEIIWALSEKEQGYTLQEIGEIFNINKSTILRIAKLKPKDWKPKWMKVV